MSRLRLLLVLAGASTLLTGLPGPGLLGSARAATAPRLAVPPAGSARQDGAADQARALRLLSAASQAARVRAYAGTQYVSSWRADTVGSSVADIRHSPQSGAVVRVHASAAGDGDASVTPTTDLDPRLVDLLGRHYLLSVAGTGTVTGRPAYVVDARPAGTPQVAGRFWIDTASALLLRRETFDSSGRLLHSSAFTTLSVGAAQPEVLPAALGSDQLTAGQLAALRQQGWQIPASFGGHLELFDARIRWHAGDPVLLLSYSDGLATLSLFTQRGRLGGAPLAGFRRQRVGRATVWVRFATPERVVWGGGGRVFTVLSDASTDTVRAAVTALPHETPARTGLLARIGRGLARLGSWLNPFR